MMFLILIKWFNCLYLYSRGVLYYVYPSESDESFHLVLNYRGIKAKQSEIALTAIRVKSYNLLVKLSKYNYIEAYS